MDVGWTRDGGTARHIVRQNDLGWEGCRPVLQIRAWCGLTLVTFELHRGGQVCGNCQRNYREHRQRGKIPPRNGTRQDRQESAAETDGPDRGACNPSKWSPD